MRRVAILSLCGAIAAAFCGWLIVRSNAVSRALSEQVRRGPGTTVDFAEVAPFAWDRLYVFGPYTPHQRIHDSLGFRWPGIRATTIEYSEGVNLVVFVRSGEVVYWFEHPRNQGELLELARPQGYSREEARFQVCFVDGEQRLALAKQQN